MRFFFALVFSYTACFASWENRATYYGQIDYDPLGHDVAISSDGSNIITSTPKGGTVLYYDESYLYVEGQDLRDSFDDSTSGDYDKVSISNNKIIAIGNPSHGNGGWDAPGRIYLRYYDASEGWKGIGGVNAISGQSGLGISLELSNNGERLIACSRKSNNGSSHLLNIYSIEQPTDSNYNLVLSSTIDLTDIAGEVESGQYVPYLARISGDGQTIIVASKFRSKNKTGICKVFKYSEGNSSWEQIGSNILDVNINDGISDIDISDNGQIIAIGSSQHDPSENPSSLPILNAGLIRIFYFDGYEWVLDKSIKGTNQEEYLGFNLALSGDGRTVVSNSNGYSNTARYRIFSNQLDFSDSSSSEWAEHNSIILNTHGLEKRVDVDYGADKIVISDPSSGISGRGAVYYFEKSSSDIDGDGISDFNEINYYYTDPENIDSDEDGLSDYDEIFNHNSNPNSNDSNNDGINDFISVQQNISPSAEHGALIEYIKTNPILFDISPPDTVLQIERINGQQDVITDPLKYDLYPIDQNTLDFVGNSELLISPIEGTNIFKIDFVLEKSNDNQNWVPWIDTVFYLEKSDEGKEFLRYKISN